MIATDLPLREDPPVFAAAEGDGLLPLRLAWAVFPAFPPSGACQPVPPPPPPLPALCAEPAEPDDELRGSADCFLLLRCCCLAGEGDAGSSTSSSSKRESWLISRYCWPLLRANGVDMVGLCRLRLCDDDHGEQPRVCFQIQVGACVLKRRFLYLTGSVH